jgi:predicted RNA-binding protein with PIN domain
MSKFYLIDGYNLLHALDAVPARAGPHVLERARARLLAMIAAAHRADSAAVTVVFDARRTPPGTTREQHHGGIHVLFSAGHDDADSLIEELIRKHGDPRRLAVVSDDHRLQRAAQRRECAVTTCGEYIDLLLHRSGAPKTTPADEPEKDEPLTGEEVEHWLHEFADLDDDPAMKELFNPFDFEGEGSQSS